jgi:2-polyprenyl-6-methoxyphenol hydroxylase-like FAD-dependent oxidoreductase
VVVAGAGPAGCAAAIRLRAFGFRVLQFEQSVQPRRAVVETLSSDAEPYLARLGVWERQRAAALRPAPGIASIWGSATIGLLDHISSVRAPAWYVERQAFDECFREVAREAGVDLTMGTAVSNVERGSDGCTVILRRSRATTRLSCDFVVDATGRLGTAACEPPIRLDRLIGLAVTGRGDLSGPLAEWPLIEACRSGWCYSTPNGVGGVSVTLFTDPDLLPAKHLRGRLWPSDATHTSARAPAPSEMRVMPSWSAYTPAATDGTRFTVGDAALAMDPLSGRGLTAALRSSLDAAEAIAHVRDGDGEVARAFAAAHLKRTQSYVAARRVYYAGESRWSDETFWARRH